MFFRPLGLRVVVVCQVVDRVGVAFCCWWVVAWTAGLGLRVGVGCCCRGGSGIGIARRDCASGLRFVVEGCARGIAGLALRVGIAFSCWRVRDCRIAGLRFLLRNSRIAGLGGEEQRDWGRGSGVREDCVVNKKKIEKHQRT